MMNITIPNLYDSDYQLWLENTINQLRRGDFQAVDWQNLLRKFINSTFRTFTEVNLLAIPTRL